MTRAIRLPFTRSPFRPLSLSLSQIFHPISPSLSLFLLEHTLTKKARSRYRTTARVDVVRERASVYTACSVHFGVCRKRDQETKTKLENEKGAKGVRSVWGRKRYASCTCLSRESKVLSAFGIYTYTYPYIHSYQTHITHVYIYICITLHNINARLGLSACVSQTNADLSFRYWANELRARQYSVSIYTRPSIYVRTYRTKLFLYVLILIKARLLARARAFHSLNRRVHETMRIRGVVLSANLHRSHFSRRYDMGLG